MCDTTKYLYKILDGGFRFEQYKFVQPTPNEMYLAECVYDGVFKKSVFEDVLTEAQLLSIYRDKGLWLNEKDLDVKKIPDKIEVLQLQLYETFLLGKSLTSIRKSLEVVKSHLNKLLEEKNVLTAHSAESTARFARNQYIACVGCGVDYYGCDGGLSTRLCHEYIQSILDDTTIRSIARHELWQKMWQVDKSPQSLFGFPLSKLCQSQLSLLSWSVNYDRIRDSMDAPDEFVLKDDDLLDGWLIWQNKKYKEEKKQREADKFSKFGDKAEIFVPVTSLEEAQRVDGFNTAGAKMAKDRKLKVVQKVGFIEEKNLPDVKRELQMQANKEGFGRR